MLLTSPLLLRAGFAHAFTTRASSERDLAAHLRVDAIAQVRQVHGARVVPASRAGAEADAIFARGAEAAPGAALRARTAVGVRVADCAPLLVADAKTGTVAAVHVGWRGFVADVIGAAVEAIAGHDLVAAIGPCIGACCFEVGDDVAERIAAACGAHGSDGIVTPREGGKAHVDLRGAIRARLRALGVDAARVDDVPGCTMHEAHFYSYRREGAATGRMLAAIATNA